MFLGKSSYKSNSQVATANLYGMVFELGKGHLNKDLRNCTNLQPTVHCDMENPS
jgi:hypothetical protein